MHFKMTVSINVNVCVQASTTRTSVLPMILAVFLVRRGYRVVRAYQTATTSSQLGNTHDGTSNAHKTEQLRLLSALQTQYLM